MKSEETGKTDTIFSPAEIERESMRIIGAELSARGVALPPEREAIVKRVIHATADFDYIKNLYFSPNAAEWGVNAVRGGVIVTDSNMALAGISKPALQRLDAAAYCLIAEDAVALEARKRGITRAAVSMEYALKRYPGAVFAIGNAPTALLRLAAAIEEDGARPALVIGAPVGFVHVTESKERIRAACTRFQIPVIAAMGRKGGSTVTAAVCNAILYSAAGMLDPARRMSYTPSEQCKIEREP